MHPIIRLASCRFVRPASARATGMRIIGVIGMLCGCFLPAAHAGIPVSSFGVWDRGATFDPKDHPFLKGSSVNSSWSDVEKSPGVFDWRELDQALARAAATKSYLYVSLGVGPEAPAWIYDQGVPKVFTDDERHLNKWEYYPYYLAPAYGRLFERLVAELGKHIRTYSAENQKLIAFIQVKTGCTGDESAYKGNPKDARYDLPKASAAWRTFRLDAFALFVKVFQEGPDQPIDLLFNSIAGDAVGERGYEEEWQWVTTHVKGGFGIKNGALSRGHHLSGERPLVEQWLPYLVDPPGLRLFRRSEMDQTWTKPWYQLNLPLNFYWGAVNALNGGQSVWDVTGRAIEEARQDGFDFSFYFFNRYAGQIDPATATDAFCALHKGLDAADTNAYPEEKYGPATPKNTARMLKICADYSPYGAQVDDPAALAINQVGQRRDQKGFNDVGWKIWPDNYTRFLEQIDADGTSVPRWRIGGPITRSSSIYARFARGFDHASAKDALYFKLHDHFFADAGPKTVAIHVVWYDASPGSTWKLVYDAGEPAMKTAATVTGNGDQQWHELSITLTDAVMHHGGLRGSDLALVNTDDRDDIFSLVEVHRGEAPEFLFNHPVPAGQPVAPDGRAPKRPRKSP